MNVNYKNRKMRMKLCKLGLYFVGLQLLFHNTKRTAVIHGVGSGDWKFPLGTGYKGVYDLYRIETKI